MPEERERHSFGSATGMGLYRGGEQLIFYSLMNTQFSSFGILNLFFDVTFQENLLKNPSSGTCLQLKGGKIQMDNCNAADLYQHWSFS